MTIIEWLNDKVHVIVIVGVILVIGACSATTAPASRPAGTPFPPTTTNQDPRNGWVELDPWTQMRCDNGPNMYYDGDNTDFVVENHPACEGSSR